MAREVKRTFDWMATLAVIYALFVAIPAEWGWFDPDTPIVADGTTTQAPAIGFKRKIMRDVRMEYQVVIRKAADLEPVCDPSSSAFTYRKDAKLPKHIDLVWWTGGDGRCWPREVGTYIMETCWTALEPMGGFLPPKRVCRDSPPFRISG